jgi:hypothetical protein
MLRGGYSSNFSGGNASQRGLVAVHGVWGGCTTDILVGHCESSTTGS